MLRCDWLRGHHVTSTVTPLHHVTSTFSISHRRECSFQTLVTAAAYLGLMAQLQSLLVVRLIMAL